MVVSNDALSTIMKFEHLCNCLEGEAWKRIKSLDLDQNNFDSAWDSICKRYDDRRLRFIRQMGILSSLPFSSKETVPHFNLLLNAANESINIFRALDRPVDKWDDIIVYFIETRLPPSTKFDWQREMRSLKDDQKDFPKYSALKEFLEERLKIQDRAHASNDGDCAASISEFRFSSSKEKPGTISHQKGRQPRKNVKDASVHLVTKKSNTPYTEQKCSFCYDKHFISYCPKFLKCSLTERIEHVSKNKLCSNCLGSSHRVASCTSKGRCLVCGAQHHTKLHRDNATEPHHPSAGSESDNLPTTSSNHAVTNVSEDRTLSAEKTVLLSTTYVTLESSDGTSVTARALLDSGAEESFITEHIVQMLNLQKKRVQVAVSGVGAEATVVANSRVIATVKSNIDSNFNLTFSALVLKKLTSLLPRTKVSSAPWTHLKHLRLADPQFDRPGRIDCILNAEVFALALRPGIERGPPCTPTAVNSVFGWLVMGPATISESEPLQVTNHHISVDRTLSSALCRFWELESIPNTPILSDEEER